MNRKIIYALILLLITATIFFIRSQQSVIAQSQCASKSQGDANCDSNIDENDYIIWRCEYLGGTNCQGDFVLASSDFNEDSETDLLDYEIWRSHRYLAPTVTQEVPTPTTETTAKPDLGVGELNLFCVDYDGEDTLTAHYDFTVRNSGSAGSPANVSEFILANPSLGISSDLTTFTVPALNQNNQTRVNGVKNVFCPLCAALNDSGELQAALGMVMALDRDEIIDEENELNNAPNYLGESCLNLPQISPTITPTRAPTPTIVDGTDLTIDASSIAACTRLVTGPNPFWEIDYSLDVRNSGNTTISGTEVEANITGRSPGGVVARTVPSLSSGQQVQVSSSNELSNCTTCPNANITFYVDPLNDVTEVNESNNSVNMTVAQCLSSSP